MADYWFGKKRIGWGVRPISLMGWLLTLVFAVMVVMLYLRYAAAGDMVGFALWTGVSLAIFVAITLLKLEPSESGAGGEDEEDGEDGNAPP